MWGRVLCFLGSFVVWDWDFK
uniref:Uncharacterized protein n=1 Tax=Rhizophora mucronata TaxID=61149 RepID=A0A2P2QDE7_RHIMU